MARKGTAVAVPPGYKVKLVRNTPGRPRSIPADARPRTVRLTDAEYRQVVDFVREIRAKT